MPLLVIRCPLGQVGSFRNQNPGGYGGNDVHLVVRGIEVPPSSTNTGDDNNSGLETISRNPLVSQVRGVIRRTGWKEIL